MSCKGVKAALAHQTVDGYNGTHEKRWGISIEWISQFFYPKGDEKVLEVSHPSRFTDIFQERFRIRPGHTMFDVRDPKGWSTLGESSFDFVINTEVIEHLADWIEPEDDHDFRCCEFYKTGMANCLAGCMYVLKPGGLLFLTTPNASSVEMLASWIYYNSPFSWDPHIRELSFYEATRLVDGAGFEMLKSGTEDPYLHRKEPKSQEYFALLRTRLNALGTRDIDRGETTFIMARKRK